MNHNNHPLRLNIGYLYHKSIGTSRRIPIAFDRLEIENLLLRNLTSVVTVSRTREGLLLQVLIDAEVQTICTRCLDDFFLEVHTNFEELYEFPSRQREETDLILPMDGYLDLSPLFCEYIILAMPIKRLCQPTCQGLCVVCGANLNITSCKHHSRSDSTPESVMEGDEV